MAKLVSKRYSVALFELAKEKNSIDELNEQVSFILSSINDNPQFLEIFSHPQIAASEKLDLFNNVFGQEISNDITALISLIINKNREAQIKEILSIFLDLVEEHKGIKTAYVYSATELEQEKLDSIKEKLSQKLNKEIIIKTQIQPDLIGGVKIFVGGIVIDNSIKKQLSDFRKVLNNN